MGKKKIGNMSFKSGKIILKGIVYVNERHSLKNNSSMNVQIKLPASNHSIPSTTQIHNSSATSRLRFF